jgi:hypothetical protein
MKSWQEIEQLQAQIANIEVSKESKKLIQLLKNLLTGYYVFAGGLENLNDDTNISKVDTFTGNDSTNKEQVVIKAKDIPELNDAVLDEPVYLLDEPPKATNEDSFEPFEYFVDFDAPIGEPLTDDDLYSN